VTASRLPADLLDRPVEEAVRRVALRELARAETARAALERKDDPEALHDFRVAVRRLRSHLRAYRKALAGDPGKKLLRRLRRLGTATNPGRDAEVGLAWVGSLGAGLRAGHRRGVDWLASRLESRRDDAYRNVEGEIVAEFGALAGALGARLARYSVELRLDRPEATAATPYRAALAAELARHAEVLAESLAHVVTVADEEEGHRARIEAKRLRYLLEPVAGRLPGAKRAVAHLKQLQDLLGELHDLQVLSTEVADAVAQTEAERARRLADAVLAGRDSASRSPRDDSRRSERPGLLALAHRIARRRDEIFGDFEREWLGEAAPSRRALAAEIRGLLDRLSPGERTPDPSPAP